MHGFCSWAGTILNVDLTTGRVGKEPLSPAFGRKYLGASGFNSAKLFQLVRPEVDGLSPENVLMFGVGTLTGTLAPGSARLTVTAKSPLTDIFGDSNIGGHFGTELKFAGYDQIVISGKANHPVYLWIDDDNVELRDASRLWGKSTWDTARMIKEEIDDPFIQVVCIGQAGENGVRFANIMSPPKRAAGRSGMGAVMGSKNLKAIAVRGSKDVTIARPEEFLQTCMEIRQTVIETYPSYRPFREYGTPSNVDLFAAAGTIGVRNYQSNVFPGWEALSGRALKRDFYRSTRACTACVVGCTHFHTVRSGEFAGVYSDGPEYGMVELGCLWEIDNLPAILKMYRLFNEFGMDCFSAGSLMAWAMDCYEKGILTKEDFDGTPLSFGDYRSVIEMIPKIAYREGFGNVLAEGEKRAPKLVGKGADKYMYHIKGQAPCADELRANKASGLQALTSTRGADHLKGGSRRSAWLLKDTDMGMKYTNRLFGIDLKFDGLYTPEGMGVAIKWCEDMKQGVDSSGVCHFGSAGSVQLLARALSSATGVDFNEKELLEIGERIYNVQKAFNSRQGLTRKDDNSVPETFIGEAIKDGPCQGMVLPRDMLLDEYYEARGWNVETGLQTREKLVELGLEHVADELEKVNAIK